MGPLAGRRVRPAHRQSSANGQMPALSPPPMARGWTVASFCVCCIPGFPGNGVAADVEGPVHCHLGRLWMTGGQVRPTCQPQKKLRASMPAALLWDSLQGTQGLGEAPRNPGFWAEAHSPAFPRAPIPKSPLTRTYLFSPMGSTTSRPSRTHMRPEHSRVEQEVPAETEKVTRECERKKENQRQKRPGQHRK